MTAVIGSAGPMMRAYLDVVATCAALAFLLLVVHPAYDYAYGRELHHHAGAADFQTLGAPRRCRSASA